MASTCCSEQPALFSSPQTWLCSILNLAIFGYSFWKCVAKLATVSKILARAQVKIYISMDAKTTNVCDIW